MHTWDVFIFSDFMTIHDNPLMANLLYALNDIDVQPVPLI